jgi:hypothetical protein
LAGPAALVEPSAAICSQGITGQFQPFEYRYVHIFTKTINLFICHENAKNLKGNTGNI